MILVVVVFSVVVAVVVVVVVVLLLLLVVVVVVVVWNFISISSILHILNVLDILCSLGSLSSGSRETLFWMQQTLHGKIIRLWSGSWFFLVVMLGKYRSGVRPIGSDCSTTRVSGGIWLLQSSLALAKSGRLMFVVRCSKTKYCKSIGINLYLSLPLMFRTAGVCED